MEWTDRGLVLAKGVFRENDVWLRVLFREHGVLMVSAFGGLKSRRRFVGCLDVMNVLECRVKERRGFHDLVEAVLLQGPGALRTRPKAQGLAMNFLKLVDSAGFTKDLSPEMLRLLEESLELLKADGDFPTAQAAPAAQSAPAGASVPTAPTGVAANAAALSLFFRLKFMGILGYAPDFLSCSLCSKPLLTRSFFSVEEGAVLCASCFGQNHAGHQGHRGDQGAWLEPSTLCLLQEARDTWPSQWAGVQDASRGTSQDVSRDASQGSLKAAFACLGSEADVPPGADRGPSHRMLVEKAPDAAVVPDASDAPNAMPAGLAGGPLRRDAVDPSGDTPASNTLDQGSSHSSTSHSSKSDTFLDGVGGAAEFDADEMAETARVLAKVRPGKRAHVGLFAFLSEKERRQASLCIDGMLSYHVGLAWDKGRYVRT